MGAPCGMSVHRKSFESIHTSVESQQYPRCQYDNKKVKEERNWWHCIVCVCPQLYIIPIEFRWHNLKCVCFFYERLVKKTAANTHVFFCSSSKQSFHLPLLKHTASELENPVFVSHSMEESVSRLLTCARFSLSPSFFDERTFFYFISAFILSTHLAKSGMITIEFSAICKFMKPTHIHLKWNPAMGTKQTKVNYSDFWCRPYRLLSEREAKLVHFSWEFFPAKLPLNAKRRHFRTLFLLLFSTRLFSFSLLRLTSVFFRLHFLLLLILFGKMSSVSQMLMCESKRFKNAIQCKATVMRSLQSSDSDQPTY